MSDPTLPPEQPEQPAQPPEPTQQAEQPYAPPPPPPPPPADYGAAPPPPPPPPPVYGAPPPAYGAAPPPPPGYGAPAYGQNLSAGDRPFSVSDAFNWGWAKFQLNAGAIVIATLIYVVVLGIVEVVAYLGFAAAFLSTTKLHVDETTGQITGGGGTSFVAFLLFAGLMSFVFFVLISVVQAAIIRGTLDIANGKKVEVGDFFKFEKIGAVLTAGLIVGAAYAVGTFLCYVPALLVAFFTPFYLFFIMDKNLAPWDAIMASVRLVSTNIASMILLILGVVLAYIVGIVVCFIGLIVTMPVALLALTFAYRKFQNEPVAA